MTSEADKFWLGYKDKFFWTIVASARGLAISPRACFLQYKPNVGFYVFCKNFTRKVAEIKANPFVTLSISEVSGGDIPVALTTAEVSTSKEVIYKAWDDEFLKYGYTSKDDERAVVIIFTIHKATLGQKEYAGAPYDYPKYKIDQTIQTFPLPEGPYQSTEGKAEIDSALKVSRTVHLLTFQGVLIRNRLVFLQQNEKLGYYFITNKTSKKYRQLIGSSNVSLLHENKTESKQVIIEGVATFVCCLDAKKSAWTEDLKKLGYSGVEDPNLKVVRVVPRRVIVHSFTPSSPVVYQFKPPQYDYIIEKLHAQYKTGIFWSLASIDEKGLPHNRTMGGNYLAPIGFIFGTHESEKIKQINANPHIAVAGFDSKSFQDVNVEGLGYVSECDLVRYAIWDDKYKNVGYTGPDDKKLKFIYLNPAKLTYSKNLSGVEQYSIYCDGKKECEEASKK